MDSRQKNHRPGIFSQFHFFSVNFMIQLIDAVIRRTQLKQIIHPLRFRFSPHARFHSRPANPKTNAHLVAFIPNPPSHFSLPILEPSLVPFPEFFHFIHQHMKTSPKKKSLEVAPRSYATKQKCFNAREKSKWVKPKTPALESRTEKAKRGIEGYRRITGKELPICRKGPD